VQNRLETLLNSGIPVKKHIYKEVILSNRMRPITNQQFKNAVLTSICQIS
jgi:hypothetical protein